MTTDPYHLLQSEIQATLQSASTLLSSYVRIRNMAAGSSNGSGKGKERESEELVWARNELKATLTTLEADLEDLEESVRVVESRDSRFFGIDAQEVIERRRYVRRVRDELSSMRTELHGPGVPSASDLKRTSTLGPPQDPAEEDHQAAWAMAEQEMLIKEQDNALDSISGTLNTLAQHAGLIGREVIEHNEMLEDLEEGTVRADGKIATAMTKMKKFIRDTEDTKSGWCIGVLIVILMALLLAVILV